MRDLEDMSPLKLLIDKRKDLKLTDAQVSTFKDSEGKLKDKNAPLFKAVDSLVREMRPGSGHVGTEDRARHRMRVSALTSRTERRQGQLRRGSQGRGRDARPRTADERQRDAREAARGRREELREKMRPAGGGGGAGRRRRSEDDCNKQIPRCARDDGCELGRLT